MAVTRWLRVACAALLVATLTAACDTKSQFAPSLPAEAGFRVDGGVLKLWLGTPCSGVIGMRLILDSGTSKGTEKEWNAPKPGVPLERMDLLGAAEGGTPLQVKTPLPAGYDWTRAGESVFSVAGPEAYGSRIDIARVLRESPGHPSDSYLFGEIGWMNPADVQRENTKSFLTICTPDPE